jgi:hypothetical protein
MGYHLVLLLGLLGLPLVECQGPLSALVSGLLVAYGRDGTPDAPGVQFAPLSNLWVNLMWQNDSCIRWISSNIYIYNYVHIIIHNIYIIRFLSFIYIWHWHIHTISIIFPGFWLDSPWSFHFGSGWGRSLMLWRSSRSFGAPVKLLGVIQWTLHRNFWWIYG